MNTSATWRWPTNSFDTIMLWCWFLNLDVVYWFREKLFSLKHIFVEIQKFIVMVGLRGCAPVRWVETCSLTGEYISHHEFIPLIHSKSGSLSFLFSDFRKHRVCGKMTVAEVRKTHNNSESHWKIHFLSWSNIVFITLGTEAGIIFGQGHCTILSHTQISIIY